jgi:peptidoglycan/LPS O-acetylase OafA/YrhL
MAKPAAPMKGRIPSLDLLRGVAVVMVLVVHAPFPEWCREGWTEKVIRTGAYGVDLFFVLSGFLISGLLFAEFRKQGKAHVVRFWLRRGMKIWPSYYVGYGAALLIICGLALRDGQPLREHLVGALPNLVFIQNYVWTDAGWFASWSLAIEEHFYTVLPLVICASVWAGWGVRGIPWACGAVCLACPLLRYLEPDAVAVYLRTHYRAEALCYGVLLGYFHHHYDLASTPIRRWWPVLVALPLVALVVPYEHPFKDRELHVAGLTALALGFAGVVALAVACPDAGRGAVAPVRWVVRTLSGVGVYSYTIYLAQSVALLLNARTSGLLGSLIGPGVDLRVPVFVATAIGGGVLLSRAVERPFLVLREKWIPRKKGAPAGQPAAEGVRAGPLTEAVGCG